MTTYFTTRGDVRGDCGHRHRDGHTAILCILSDRRACNAQGGYSDRSLYRVSDNGETLLVLVATVNGVEYVEPEDEWADIAD